MTLALSCPVRLTRATGITITRPRSRISATVNITTEMNIVPQGSHIMTMRNTAITPRPKQVITALTTDTNIMPRFRLTTATMNITTTASGITRRRRAITTGGRVTARSRMPLPSFPGPGTTVTAIITMTPLR